MECCGRRDTYSADILCPARLYFFFCFVMIADVNGDQIPDMIALDGYIVTTLLGNGDGTFRAGPSTNAPWQAIYDGVAVDVNGDGIVDLVLAGGVDGVRIPSGIGVFLGNGDGTFQAPVFYQTGTDDLLGYLVTGDFNGDGIPDFALPSESGIWLFTGKGGGVLNPGVLTPVTGIQSSEMVAADFNGDGKLDLAVTTLSGFLLLSGNGDGTFQTPVAYNAGPSGPRFIATADINRDGHPDIALALDTTNTHNYDLIYLNNGLGGFSGPTGADIDGAATQITLGDVNGDGIPDLINDAGSIAFGKGDGTFHSPISYPVQILGGENVVVADLRNNGLTDIVVAGADAISVLLAQGKGSFEDGVWTSVAGTGNCAAAADFNGDGKPDLAVPTT